MAKAWSVVAVVCLWLALPDHVLAQENAPRRGTRAILELGGGVTLSSTPGPAFYGLIGTGGKLSGTPLRGYLLAELAYQNTLRAPGLQWREDGRRDVILGVGGRLYIALPDRLRIFLDALGGSTWNTSRWVSKTGLKLSDQGWYPQFTAGFGVQYRLLYALSLGARARVLVAGDGLSQLREAQGRSPQRPWSLTLGVTWHL